MQADLQRLRPNPSIWSIQDKSIIHVVQVTQSSVLLKSQQEVFPHPAEEDGAHKHLHRTRAPGMCQAATRTRTWHNIAPCNNNVQLPSSSSPPASPASPPDRVVQWCQASVLVSQMWTLFLRRCSSGFFAWRGKVCYGVSSHQ